jgi:hypothetical protein
MIYSRAHTHVYVVRRAKTNFAHTSWMCACSADLHCKWRMKAPRIMGSVRPGVGVVPMLSMRYNLFWVRNWGANPPTRDLFLARPTHTHAPISHTQQQCVSVSLLCSTCGNSKHTNTKAGRPITAALRALSVSARPVRPPRCNFRAADVTSAGAIHSFCHSIQASVKLRRGYERVRISRSAT